MKKCCQCLESKDESEFYTAKKALDGLSCYCKICTNARSVRWNKANPQRYYENWTRWRLNHRVEYNQRRLAESHKRRELCVQ